MRSWAYGVAVVAALAIGYGCDTSRANNPTDEAAIDVDDITANPEKYIGQTVTLEAEVNEVHGPDAFSLDEDNPVAGGIDNDLLVLSPQAASLADMDDTWLNDKVRVTGTVARMSVVELEREIGWDLTPELEARIENRAVLIAKSVERIE